MNDLAIGRGKHILNVDPLLGSPPLDAPPRPQIQTRTTHVVVEDAVETRPIHANRTGQVAPRVRKTIGDEEEEQD